MTSVTINAVRNKKLHNIQTFTIFRVRFLVSLFLKHESPNSEHEKLPRDRIIPPLLTQAIDTRRHFVVPHKQHPRFGAELHTSFNCCVLWGEKNLWDIVELCGFLCQACFTQGPPAEIQHI